MQYLRDHWADKLPLWTKGGLAEINHSGIFTNAHIESYHMVLKAFDLTRARSGWRHARCPG